MRLLLSKGKLGGAMVLKVARKSWFEKAGSNRIWQGCCDIDRSLLLKLRMSLSIILFMLPFRKNSRAFAIVESICDEFLSCTLNLS